MTLTVEQRARLAKRLRQEPDRTRRARIAGELRRDDEDRRTTHTTQTNGAQS